MNFIHLLLSQFFTVILQFRTSNSLQRVYLHNVLFLACFNWEFFQGVKIHDTMSLNNVQNSVGNISPLDSTWAITSIQVTSSIVQTKIMVFLEIIFSLI